MKTECSLHKKHNQGYVIGGLIKILKLCAYRIDLIQSSLIKQKLCDEHTISVAEVLFVCNNGYVDATNKKYNFIITNDVYHTICILQFV